MCTHNQPVVIYDGNCAFCISWARRAQGQVGGRVRFVTAAGAVAELPESAVRQARQVLVMLMPDGAVTAGAHAVFQFLSCRRRWRLLLHLYRISSLFRWFTESVYSLVAKSRSRILN